MVTLGQLAGAVPTEGDGGNDAAPDATWIFGSTIWVAWEAKSAAKPDGELGANDVRQAGGHLRFIAAQRGESAPGDSPALLMAPQDRIHPSAHAVAENHVYLVRPDEVVDLFDRLVRAWRTARTRDLASLSAANLMPVFAAEGALPTQWLPRLRGQPLRLEGDAA